MTSAMRFRWEDSPRGLQGWRYPLPWLGPGPAPGPPSGRKRVLPRRPQAGWRDEQVPSRAPASSLWAFVRTRAKALLGDGGPVILGRGNMPPWPRWDPSSPHHPAEKPLLLGRRDTTMRLSWWRTPGPTRLRTTQISWKCEDAQTGEDVHRESELRKAKNVHLRHQNSPSHLQEAFAA